MSPSTRHPPRFLPTLTEVVHAPSLGTLPARAAPETEDIVRAVLQTVEPMMDRRLAEEADAMVRALVNEQMTVVSACLRQEMAILVRQVVSETIASLRDSRAS
jgi:hypothetical protein